jgi:hypothetical protein
LTDGACCGEFIAATKNRAYGQLLHDAKVWPQDAVKIEILMCGSLPPCGILQHIVVTTVTSFSQ